MKNSIYVLMLCSTLGFGMDAPHVQKQTSKEKFLARTARFFDRLPYFETVQECDDSMTTDSDADREYQEGLISQQELMEWRAKRNQERIAHELKIQSRKKNIRVEVLLKNTTLNCETSLYCDLTSSRYKNLSTYEALKAAGYEADTENQ